MIVQNNTTANMDTLIHEEEALDEEEEAELQNDSNRSVTRRKSSLTATPEDEPLENARGPNDTKYGTISPPSKQVIKVLLVFQHHDPVQDTLIKAAEKLNFDITSCNTENNALEEYQSKSHDLVIVDSRSIKAFDYETICRSIRNTKSSQHSCIVAIVKKSAFEKDDITILSLLDSGFNRCLVETTNLTTCINEMILLKHSDVRLMSQHATCQAMYVALDKCKDLVIVTDDNYKVQYLNRACEKQLSLKQEDAIGKSLQDQFIYDTVQLNSMGSSLLRAREWNGTMTLKKKSQETIVTSCKGMPFSCAGRIPTHFILVIESNVTESNVLSQARGSIHSLRRGSNDVRSVGSDFYRRTSLAKLNSLPLEAPITKIITLLDQARESSNNTGQVIQLLDRVEDILRTPELYSPHMKDDLRVKSDEPVASDLITALLSTQTHPSLNISSRRSSNDSTVNPRVSRGFMKISSALKELLQTSLSWEFDIFRLEDLTKKHPLQQLGMNLFLHFDTGAALNCEDKTLFNWLTVIEANYHVENTYHNSTHAADVMQATAGYLEKERMKAIMDPLDEATSLIAAAAHDVDHPGKSSAFLANSNNSLAVLYNDVSILESHHAALMFKLTLGDDRVNIFKNLDRETYKLARTNVIDMILATEMTKHFEHLAKFVNVFCTRASGTENELSTAGDNGDGQLANSLQVANYERKKSDAPDYIPINLPENIVLVKRMMIKCADVNNPTRPLRLCVEWSRRIAEEYFQQTDEEKAKGLPVVMPMFDRNTCSIPKSQIGFIDYIINDMMEAWNAFIDMPELLSYMRENYIKWKEFDEQGHTTLADIRKLQNTILMSPYFPTNKSGKSD